MRKKIPTITRPDPAYAASLRPEVEEDPGREDVQRAEATPEPASAQPVVVDDHIALATRKIDIRVNALERQEDALIDCGVDPAHIIRAALRRAVKTWQLGPDFIAPSEEQRTRINEWRARTSLAVHAGAMNALLRAHDPLDVLSKWTLIRGQLEPRVWAEIDTLLVEIAVQKSDTGQT